MTKVIDLEKFKQEKQLKKLMSELDRIALEEYPFMSPTEQKGYRNFMKLLKLLDKKHEKENNVKE